MLVDSDITFSEDRGKPLPNTHDLLPSNAIWAKGTNSINYVTPGSNQSILEGARNGQFNIVQSGTITSTLSSYTPSYGAGFGSFKVLLAQVPHNLPNVPGLWIFINEFSTYIPLPWFFKTTSTGGGVSVATQATFRASVDATYIYIYLEGLGIGTAPVIQTNYTFKYYLTEQTSN